jgi:hypothetical protein
VAEVRRRLGDLDADAARRVLAYERAHKARRSLVPVLERAASR